jgi:signal peptidase I
MEPTLTIGQRVLVDRLSHGYKVGDIIVFYPPAGAEQGLCDNQTQTFGGQGAACDKTASTRSSQTFIKRIVAVGGDRISIVQGRVMRNGRQELAPYAQVCSDPQACNFPKTITVPRGYFFVMGDNRAESDDSRFWGPVPARWIIGKAFATYWPLNRLGTL